MFLGSPSQTALTLYDRYTYSAAAAMSHCALAEPPRAAARPPHHGHKRRPRAPKPFEEADVVDQRDTGLVVVAVDVVGSKHTFQQRSGQRRVALASESPENAATPMQNDRFFTKK